MERWFSFRRRSEGEEGVEIPSVCIFLSASLESSTYPILQSASGYLLFPLFLMTAAVGGNYSDWSTNNVNLIVRLLVFTVAPVFILLGLWGRIRLSKMNFRQ